MDDPGIIMISGTENNIRQLVTAGAFLLHNFMVTKDYRMMQYILSPKLNI